MTRLFDRQRPLLALAAGILAVGLLAPAASATRLHWVEAAKDGKTPVMSFEVSDVTFGKSAWSVHASFKNVSKQTITIGNEFGVAFFGDAKSTDVAHAIGFAVAQAFSPARPARLQPGASWTGVISGTGRLKSSDVTRYARVVFGPLTNLPGQSKPVFWITDHAMPIAPKATGPVI